MMLAQADIDRVVREVLQRLVEAQAATSVPAAAATQMAVSAATPAVTSAVSPAATTAVSLAATSATSPSGGSGSKSIPKATSKPPVKAIDQAMAKPMEKVVAKPAAKSITKPAAKSSASPSVATRFAPTATSVAKSLVRSAGKADMKPVSSTPSSPTPTSRTPTSPSASPTLSPSLRIASSPVDSRTWDFGERLLTVAALESMPAGTRVLSARSGTVITPSARDRLRQLRVELSFTSGAVVASAAPAMKLYLHAAKDPAKVSKSPAPRAATYRAQRFGAGPAVSPHSWPARQSVLRALQGVAASVETLIAAPLEQTAAELSAVLAAPYHLGVLFTTERDWAACVANRRESIRAVVATDKVSIEAAARDWGANLLIIDDRRSSPHTIRGWIDTFLRSGPRLCPASRAHWLATEG